nr:hypothetical protein BaRGS_026118 [Batillaria attramentaria]
MKNYKIGVLGLSETRWLQTGQLRFSSGEQLLYSGHTEDGAPHTEGVALMLAPEAQRALIGWEPVNSRIITAKFITKKKDIKLNIIQCYAPTNDAEEEKKDEFYQQLQTVIDRGGAKDMTILMGDFNAKIGSDNTGYEDTMGTHGLGQMNENGERFADFCALNQLVIGGSIFPHKRIHKATWRSPDHVTENQIDHICISRKFRRSWRDVRVMRGADVSSDHHLLATTLRLRLKRHTNANSTRTRYNVGLLRNTDTQAAFRISLSNRFQPLQDLIEDSEMDIETQWEHSKKLWHDTCEEVLGKRKTQHKEWISADTIQKLEVRKEKKTALNTSRTRRAKAKAQEEYTAADREVKRSTRKDKRDYIDNLASQAEEAARQGNLKDLYQVTKKLAGKFQQTDKPVKDKNGHPLTTTEEQLKRWAEHFRELLNRPIPETPPDIPPAETELPINCDKPSKAEIRKAIMTLRNGKAAGPDEIPAEAIKADTETAVNMLHSLFSKIWEKEEVPAQWKEGIVIKLPKKGDLRDCSNYRGIMLLSVPGKVLNRILLERMREAVDPMLRDQQAGFRRNRSCADQIASLRIIVEQSLEWNSPLYINFIDYEKAFDSVDREALWKLLRHYGVPGKIISLIQCTYQDMSCRIAHAGQLSESFEVKTGVRQGCLLSPFLFLLVIDWIMKTTTAGRKNGIQWTLWTQLDDLDFADDLALLSHSHSQMQDKTTCLEATSAGTGLKINRKKTELMKINTTANTPVTVGGEPIREEESFVYLGSVVDGQGGTDRDVTARIGKARAAMVMLKNVWASKVVSIRTKLRIFNSNVKSVLLYGCETWRTTKTMQQKIQTFLNTCLRRIFNIRWPEKIRNEELWERAGQEPVAKQILRRKWGWIGHTLRKPASSTTRQALTWNPQGKRKRGRPRNSWRRDTEAELLAVKGEYLDPHCDGKQVIVHLFEWKWTDIAAECERFLGPWGFCGVQVSPPHEHVVITTPPAPWWQRYQPVSYKLVSRIYADVVVNHMAGAEQSGRGSGGTSFDGSTLSYPGVPYSAQNFNPRSKCPSGDGHVNNYGDPNNVRNCYLLSLTDLDQSQDYVRGKIVDYYNSMLDLGVAGFRVDASKHMWPQDLAAIQGATKDTQFGGKPFYMHEVIDQNDGAIKVNEYYNLGRVTEFRYCQKITEGVHNFGALSAVVDYGVMSSYSFGDNSDQGPPHNADYSTADVPINSDGSCGGGWVCEHRWPSIRGMALFRTAAAGTDVHNYYNQNDVVAFSRGNKAFFAMGKRGFDQTFQTGLPAGQYCDLISNCAQKITVDGSGNAHASPADNQDPVVAIIAARPVLFKTEL